MNNPITATTNTKHLLIITHAPSDNTQKLTQALFSSAQSYIKQTPDSETSSEYSLHVTQRHALEATSTDVLGADAIILMTPENLGYLSGGMKDFFDRIYYPCLELKQGLPTAAIIRAGQDGTGAKRALETITTGLKWRWVQAPIICRGAWQETFISQAEELAAAIALGLQQGII